MKGKFNGNDSPPLKAGSLLLTEKPFAFVLSSKEKGLRCDYCLMKAKVLKCSGCQFSHYCGRVCQKEAWNEHKWECGNLKRVAPKVIPDAARMMAKIICRLCKGDGNTARSQYAPNSFRMWKDLMSHYPDLKADRKRMDHFTSLSSVLYEFLKDLSLPNAVEMMGIYGRMCINSFTVLDVDMNSIGTALYLGASVVDHGCRPNAVATFQGHTISIRTTVDVDCLNWDQVRISYIDLMKTPFERQSELLANYYFLCECVRCLDDYQLSLMHAAKCPNSECSDPVNIPWKKDVQVVMKPATEKDKNQVERIGETLQNGEAKRISINQLSEIQNGGEVELANGADRSNTNVCTDGEKFQNGLCDDVLHCKSCGTKIQEDYVERFVKAMEFTELHLQNMKNAGTAYVDVCKYCLDHQDTLHDLNILRAQTLDHAFDALIETQLWEQACSTAVKLIPCFRNYYGDRHPLLGILHLKYGKILSYLARLPESLEQLKAAASILKITHGDRHELYRDELMPLLSQVTAELNS